MAAYCQRLPRHWTNPRLWSLSIDTRMDQGGPALSNMGSCASFSVSFSFTQPDLVVDSQMMSKDTRPKLDNLLEAAHMAHLKDSVDLPSSDNNHFSIQYTADSDSGNTTTAFQRSTVTQPDTSDLRYINDL